MRQAKRPCEPLQTMPAVLYCEELSGSLLIRDTVAPLFFNPFKKAHHRGEEEDLLAQAQALMNSMGGSERPDGERLRRYRERETERHLTRVDQLWEGCVVLKHSTSRGMPNRLSSFQQL